MFEPNLWEKIKISKPKILSKKKKKAATTYLFPLPGIHIFIKSIIHNRLLLLVGDRSWGQIVHFHFVIKPPTKLENWKKTGFDKANTKKWSNKRGYMGTLMINSRFQ